MESPASHEGSDRLADVQKAQPFGLLPGCFNTSQVWLCCDRNCRWRKECLLELADAVASEP